MASMRPDKPSQIQCIKGFRDKHHWVNGFHPTIVILVQALKREAQLLLVVLQVLGELVEVQTPILVLITRGHDFLQAGGQKREC